VAAPICESKLLHWHLPSCKYCLASLKSLCKALHKLFYAEYIIMQSDTKRLSAYQLITIHTLQYHFA
jgi:hypothetical protein